MPARRNGAETGNRTRVLSLPWMCFATKLSRHAGGELLLLRPPLANYGRQVYRCLSAKARHCRAQAGATSANGYSILNERIEKLQIEPDLQLEFTPSLNRGLSARVSRRRDSNPRPTVYKTVALPLSYVGNYRLDYRFTFITLQRRRPLTKSSF